jgi:hypothetical protein
MTNHCEVSKIGCREQNLPRMCQKWEGKDEALKLNLCDEMKVW